MNGVVFWVMVVASFALTITGGTVEGSILLVGAALLDEIKSIKSKNES